jgi:hypothetical protein
MMTGPMMSGMSRRPVRSCTLALGAANPLDLRRPFMVFNQAELLASVGRQRVDRADAWEPI